MPRTITFESDSNPRFRSWKRQLTGRKGRDRDLTLVSGRRMVAEALSSSPDRVRYVLLTRGLQLGELAPLPPAAEVVQLAPSLFRELDLFGTRQPLLLVAPSEIPAWDPNSAGPGAWVAVPFQDPANAGGVVRTALGLGAAGVVFMPGAASPWHPKTLRASAGAILRIPIFRSDTWPEPSGMTLLALDAGGQDIRTVDFPERFMLMPGVEGPGLPEQVNPSLKLRLPMADALESYNAMVATALALYVWSEKLTR